jgi:hypothetical protein
VPAEKGVCGLSGVVIVERDVNGLPRLVVLLDDSTAAVVAT